jgi:hypothetical protein
MSPTPTSAQMAETAEAPGASMTALSPKLAFMFDEALRLSLPFMVAIVIAK